MDPIVCSTPQDDALAHLLRNHPAITVDERRTRYLEFGRNERVRTLTVGAPEGDTFGLPEIMDNNPLVCADKVALPPPVTTLVLTALAPLWRAGLVLEPPIVQVNSVPTEHDGGLWWASAGWSDTVDLEFVERPTGTVLAAQAMAIVTNPSDWNEIDDLYDEAYGRSFYVRRDESSEWHASLVEHRPHAVYRLRLTPDEPSSLLTIQVIADVHGKCGAAQSVHTMNVMAGFEECLGIPEKLLFG